MTGRLAEAFRRVQELPPEAQDSIADEIVGILDSDEAWEKSFRENPEKLHRLADEALEEHRHGETRPLDELIG